MSDKMVYPKHEDQVKNIVARINSKARASTVTALFFFVLSALVVMALALRGVKAAAILPIYGYFIGSFLFEIITIIMIVLTLFFVYGRIGKDDESASSSALVIGVISLLTGNVTAGVVLLVTRQFLPPRLDIHYNFK